MVQNVILGIYWSNQMLILYNPFRATQHNRKLLHMIHGKELIQLV